jgi:G3E family GTPase
MKRTRFVAIGGFLGAGKTTTVLKALEALRTRGLTGAYIANDQGEALVDTALAKASKVEVDEVLGGCFCCRFDELAATAVRLAETLQPDVILAEAVGSCTDLIATVVNPLKMYHARRFEIAPYTVVVDPGRYHEINANNLEAQGNVAYLFNKQIEEAQLVALNKLDLLPVGVLPTLTRQLHTHAPGADIVSYSAHSGSNLEELLGRWLGETSSQGQALELDYDVYAAAEADLAWLNLALSVTGVEGGFQPTAWVQRLLTNLGAALDEAQANIGHVKATLATENGFTKASLIQNGGEVHITHTQTALAMRGDALINARAQIEPALLEKRLRDAIEKTNAVYKVQSRITHLETFRPARPEPTYRLEHGERQLLR